MRVVRLRDDRSVEVLGECDDFSPPKQPGDVIEVRAQPLRITGPDGAILPYGLLLAAAPPMRFRVLGLWQGDGSEVVVQAEPEGPHPRFLPGWREAHPA